MRCGPLSGKAFQWSGSVEKLTETMDRQQWRGVLDRGIVAGMAGFRALERGLGIHGVVFLY